MYESYFGLSAKPFQLNPDPAFFYGSRGHKRAMAYLEYGLHQNEGFIVITGEVGAGKTTLVRSLLEHLDPKKVIAAQLVSTQIDADDILRLVAAAFGIPSRNLQKADLLLALETFLVSTTASGKRALLIVDEAQNLTPRAVEELRMLSNFQLEDHALLQSFLIGQPEFRQIMQSPQMLQLRQRVIASYHLGPLDREETRAYVQHRLSHVGWKRDPTFEDDAFNGIYGFSGGVPRKINTLCDRLLLAAFLNERHIIRQADVAEVVDELRQEQEAQGASFPGQLPADGAQSPAPDLLADLMVPQTLLRQLAQAPSGFDVARMESRIVQLEQSVSTLVRLMNHLVGDARSATKENVE
ncbi:MAG: XrtA-associated ATPase [Rhodocyclaceae bacterium]|jgi:putative secretion ATPase (PEP-CTERM system associated)|nr:XrtA-associated ATPase [Rhodocyclaceae bacterium]